MNRRVSACIEYVEEPEAKQEMVLTINRQGVRGKVGPIVLRTEPLSIRRVFELLNENEMDASLERDRIELYDQNIMIRNEKDMLIVEGNVGEEFQRVQALLSEQFMKV